jgi:AcrR family transcriptional regulator
MRNHRARTKASAAPARGEVPTSRGKDRAAQTAARREAILQAALEEFGARGFAATRLDDVARRAGVAKGTIYLYFADKDALFQDIVLTMLTPLVGKLEQLRQLDLPFRAIIEQVIALFVTEVLETDRKNILRLIMTEGPRFPELAEFHYREVVSRAMDALQVLLRRAADRGEIRHPELMMFPQLVVAPALMAIIWNSLFETFAPLDARALLRAHVEILFSEGTAS